MISCLLCGCVIIPCEDKFYVYDTSDVSSVEIYYIDTGREIGDYTIEMADPFYVLEESQLEEFLTDLGSIEYRDYIVIVLAAMDQTRSYDSWTAKIIFTDGSYRLLSCGGYGEVFDAKGNRIKGNHYSCDYDEWYSLMKKHVPGAGDIITQEVTTEST